MKAVVCIGGWSPMEIPAQGFEPRNLQALFVEQ